MLRRQSQQFGAGEPRCADDPDGDAGSRHLHEHTHVPHDHATIPGNPRIDVRQRVLGRLETMIPGSPPTKGRLLVATPPLEDANFDRTVIFMLEHHDEGAIGVVINRPSHEALDEPLDRWIDLQSAPSSVFSGGPVEEICTDRPRRDDVSALRRRTSTSPPSSARLRRPT